MILFTKVIPDPRQADNKEVAIAQKWAWPIPRGDMPPKRCWTGPGLGQPPPPHSIVEGRMPFKNCKVSWTHCRADRRRAVLNINNHLHPFNIIINREWREATSMVRNDEPYFPFAFPPNLIPKCVFAFIFC